MKKMWWKVGRAHYYSTSIKQNVSQENEEWGGPGFSTARVPPGSLCSCFCAGTGKGWILGNVITLSAPGLPLKGLHTSELWSLIPAEVRVVAGVILLTPHCGTNFHTDRYQVPRAPLGSGPDDHSRVIFTQYNVSSAQLRIHCIQKTTTTTRLRLLRWGWTCEFQGEILYGEVPDPNWNLCLTSLSLCFNCIGLRLQLLALHSHPGE